MYVINKKQLPRSMSPGETPTPDLQLLIYFKPDAFYYVAITEEVQNGLPSLSTKSTQFSFN